MTNTNLTSMSEEISAATKSDPRKVPHKRSSTTTLTDLRTQGEAQNDDRDVDGIVESKEDSEKYAYRCLTCGKAYMYLLSYQKHLERHNRRTSQNLQTMYSCPMCGKGFYRETRLRGHMLSHMSHEVHRCDQCNKTFDHISLWLDHEELHKTRPFWCLSCSKGFIQEDYLNKHIQRHHLGKYKCNYCSKRFLTSPLLSDHLSSFHASSQKKFTVGSGDESVTEDMLIANVKEEGEPRTCGDTEGSKEQKSGELDKSGEPLKSQGLDQSEASDCGELMQQPSKSLTSPADEISKVEPPQELDGSEQMEKNHDGEQYWEFECFECGMGFEEMSQLHLHYVKHAIGEVPFPDNEV